MFTSTFFFYLLDNNIFNVQSKLFILWSYHVISTYQANWFYSFCWKKMESLSFSCFKDMILLICMFIDRMAFLFWPILLIKFKFLIIIRFYSLLKTNTVHSSCTNVCDELTENLLSIGFWNQWKTWYFG